MGRQHELGLLPFDADRFYSRFHAAALRASDIFIVSMDFRDNRLKGALRAALLRGARLTFIVSSDWYYVMLTGKPAGTASIGDPISAIALQTEFPDLVTVRFLETNFYVGNEFNTVHHKLALFFNEKTVELLFGSTNMNTGAITHNLDQFYWTGDASLVSPYQDYVKSLLGRSYRAGQMPESRPEIIAR